MACKHFFAVAVILVMASLPCCADEFAHSFASSSTESGATPTDFASLPSSAQPLLASFFQAENRQYPASGETLLGEGVGNHRSSCLDSILPRSNLALPLMKELAEERGVTLPLALGVSGIWTELDRNVAISDVRLGLGNMPPVPANRVEVPETQFHASTQIARVDLWTLPFFNVYGIAGHTRSTGNVQVTIDRFPFPSSPPIAIDVPVELEGPTVGFGATGAVGTKDWFLTLDVNKTWSSFSQLESSLTALVMAPRLGLIIDRPLLKGELHVGAMWQDTAQTVELIVDHPALGNGLYVEVDQFEPRPWNFLVGGLWAIDERIQFLVEGGMGGRSYILSGFTVRF